MRWRAEGGTDCFAYGSSGLDCNSEQSPGMERLQFSLKVEEDDEEGQQKREALYGI